MTDERGGRYFREARFFLVGDKAVAQSHILEARSLMGYMRDMHSLGGPSFQTRYAALPDGTQIKATMLNGQYQAEIVSPPPRGGGKCKRPRTPTIFGYRLHDAGLPTERKEAFKWQEETGLVYLPTPGGYTIGTGRDIPPTISLDGETVAGEVFTTGGGYAQHVVWGSDNGVEIVPAADAVTHLMDVTYGDITPIPVPTVWTESTGDQLNWHRYIRVPEDDCTSTGDHLIFGRVEWPSYASAATVERSGTAVEDDVLTVLNPLEESPWSMITGADMGGNLLVGWSGVDTNGANIPAKWERPDRDSPYVESSLDIGTVGTTYVSNDGHVFTGTVAQYRFNLGGTSLLDQVPASWTSEEGLVQLSPFIYPADSTENAFQSEVLRGAASDGAIVVGYVIIGSDMYPRAWRKVDGAWETVPELDALFPGECVAVN